MRTGPRPRKGLDPDIPAPRGSGAARSDGMLTPHDLSARERSTFNAHLCSGGLFERPFEGPFDVSFSTGIFEASHVGPSLAGKRALSQAG